ncbi:MAG: hypothetical protein ACKVQJ_02270 [Pyrinomonadaceae bacterium]
MKRKLIMSIALIALFGLSIAVFAYSRTTISSAKAMSCCCCSGDSCPVKNKGASTGETASCCDNCDCCKGDSCPMKHDGEKMAGMPESCPMMNKGGNKENTAVLTTAATDHKAGCDCSCCKQDKEKKDVPAV